MKLTTHIIFFNLILSNLIFSQSFFSEDSLNNRNCYWIGLGLGGNYFGPNLSVIISYNNNHDLYSFKFSKSDEFNLGVENNFDNPYLTMKEYSFLYGKTLREKIILLGLSAGLSYLNGVNRGKQIENKEYEKVKINTVGIPFEAELMLEFSNIIGAGFIFYGNINKDKVITGVMFRIKFGSF